MVLALDGTAVLVNLGDGDLDGSVVLGLDDAVGGAALAGDVAIETQELVSQTRNSVFFFASVFFFDSGRLGMVFFLPPKLPHALHQSGVSVGTYRSTISPLSFSILADLSGDGP